MFKKICQTVILHKRNDILGVKGQLFMEGATMKKILCSGLLLLGLGLQLFLIADLPDFSKNDLQKYNDLVGYDLGLRVWRDSRENIIPGRASLFVHGFGGSPITMNSWLRVAGPDRIPGDIVTFRFYDATDTNQPNLSLMSLGQKTDILSLLVACKAMKAVTGDLGWNIIGPSRGGATVINTLAVLNQPVDTWDSTFKKSHITEQERLSLLQCIKKGVEVIETPLSKTENGVRGHSKRWLEKTIGQSVPDLLVSPVFYLANYVVLPFISWGKYLPWGKQALDSVDHLPNGLKVLLHFQKNDQDVGNAYDAELVEKMTKRLGKENVWAVLSNDGGKELDDITWQALEKVHEQGLVKRLLNRKIRAHNAGIFTLLQRGVISAFYKMHGGAYVNDPKHLNEGNNILEASHMVNYDNIKKYCENYDVHTGNF